MMNVALKKASSKLKRDGLALRRELSQLASNLVGRPIRVVFEKCRGAFTDFNKVVIDPHHPSFEEMTDEEFILAMKALACHEAGGHLVFTDKTEWERFILSVQNKPHGIVARNILNILEDARVELACVNRRPGSLKFIRWFNETLVKKTKLDGYDELGAFLKGLNMLGAVGYLHGQSSPEVMDLLEKCRPVIEEARRAKTTRGAVVGTEKILELAKDFIQRHLSQRPFDQFVVVVVDELSGADKDKAQQMPNITRDTHRQKGTKSYFGGSARQPNQKEEEEPDKKDGKNVTVSNPSSDEANPSSDEEVQSEEDKDEALASGIGAGNSSATSHAAGNSSDDQGSYADDEEEKEGSSGSSSTGSADNAAEQDENTDEGEESGDGFDSGEDSEGEEGFKGNNGQENNLYGDEDTPDDSEGTGNSGETAGSDEDDTKDTYDDEFNREEGDKEEDDFENTEDEPLESDDGNDDGDASNSESTNPFGGGGGDSSEEEEFSSLYNQIRQDLERLAEEEEELEEQAEQEAFEKSELLKVAEEVKWGVIHQGVTLHTTESQPDEKAFLEAYELVRLQVGVLVSDLRNILERKKDTFITRLRRGRIDPRRAIRDELGDPRIMRRRGLPSEELDVAIQVMIDGSGSMSGRRQLYARMAAILLHLTCQELRIPHSIVTFWAHWDRAEVEHVAHVRFEDCFNPATRYKIKNQAYDNARDGYSIRVLAQYLQKQPAKTKVLIVISDGAPNHECPGPNQYMYDKALQDTVRAVREVEANGIKVLGISIGDEHWYMPVIYPRRICLTNTASLPKRIAEVIEEIVRG